jgi:hypothetical protein
MVIDPKGVTAQRPRNAKTSSELRNVRQMAIQALADLRQPQPSRAVHECVFLYHCEPAEVTGPVGSLEVEKHAVKGGQPG